MTAPTAATATPQDNQRKVFIKTYGCQMNVYDSERMAEALGTEGYEQTHLAEEADMVLLNTCHIREKAAEKVYSELGRLRAVAEARRAEGRRAIVGVAGCVAQAEGEEIARRGAGNGGRVAIHAPHGALEPALPLAAWSAGASKKAAARECSSSRPPR